MPVKAAEEIPDRASTYTVSFSITLGLDVNPVKSKSSLIDHAINTVVATSTDGAASVGGRAAVTHAEKQVDEKALKEIGRSRANAIEKVLGERGIDLPVRDACDSVGRFRLARERQAQQGLGLRQILSGFDLELFEFCELAQEIIVDTSRISSDYLLSSRSDGKIATSGNFK